MFVGSAKPTRILFSYGEAVAIWEPFYREVAVVKWEPSRTAASKWHLREWLSQLGNPVEHLNNAGEFNIALACATQRSLEAEGVNC